MRAICKKHKLWMGIAGYAVFLALISYFFIFPILAKIQFNVDETQRRMIDVELSRARISKIGEMEKALKTFEEKEIDLDIMLHPAEEVQFIQNLEVLAEETGNTIAIKIKEDDKTKTKEEAKDSIKGSLPFKNYLGVEVSLEGDYVGMLAFIHKIESMQWCTQIISIKAALAEKNGSGRGSESALFSPGLSSGSSGSDGEDKEILKTIFDLAICIKK